METKVFVLRHGQTEANKTGRFAGRTPEPLTEEGEKQARLAGRLLSREEISKVFVSPLFRTRRTAELLVEELGYEVPIEFAPGFLEINIPSWEGKYKYELKRDPKFQYEVWVKAPHRFFLPDSETLAEVYGRAVREMERLFWNEKGKTVVVVTHMVIVRVLLVHYLELPLSFYRELPVPNALPFLFKRTNSEVTVEVPYGDDREAEKTRKVVAELTQKIKALKVE